ncbi:MAG TPA: hypothetical protein VIQ03_00725 [Gammaproteobacteria bacterium]
MPLSANSEHIISYRWRLATVVYALLSVIVFPLPAVSSPIIQLTSDTEQATAGYFRLSWNAQMNTQQNITYELQQSTQDGFAHAKTIYLGADTARVISGKSNGDYSYRVRTIENDSTETSWSEPVKITVLHHSFTKAIAFFVAGAIVFLMTLIYILRQRNQ